VAIETAEARVRAFHVSGGIDDDVFALGVFQPGGGAVTEQTVRSLLGARIWNEQYCQEKDEENNTVDLVVVSPTVCKTWFRRQIYRVGPHDYFPDPAWELLESPGGISASERIFALGLGTSWRGPCAGTRRPAPLFLLRCLLLQGADVSDNVLNLGVG